MFRLLSDLEVALNEVLVACHESIDHFNDATQLVNNEFIARELTTIASNRKRLITQLEAKVRELGDLPAVPDPDKEESEILLHHLGAAITNDYTNTILAQRIEAEKNIQQLIHKLAEADADGECETLLRNLTTHTAETLQKLTAIANE